MHHYNQDNYNKSYLINLHLSKQGNVHYHPILDNEVISQIKLLMLPMSNFKHFSLPLLFLPHLPPHYLLIDLSIFLSILFGIL